MQRLNNANLGYPPIPDDSPLRPILLRALDTNITIEERIVLLEEARRLHLALQAEANTTQDDLGLTPTLRAIRYLTPQVGNQSANDHTSTNQIAHTYLEFSSGTSTTRDYSIEIERTIPRPEVMRAIASRMDEELQTSAIHHFLREIEAFSLVRDQANLTGYRLFEPAMTTQDRAVALSDFLEIVHAEHSRLREEFNHSSRIAAPRNRRLETFDRFISMIPGIDVQQLAAYITEETNRQPLSRDNALREYQPPRNPGQDVMAAVRRDDREFIDQYAHEHSRESNLRLILSTAAQLAQGRNNAALAAHLMQLVTENDETQQPAAELVVVLNKNEERLKKCNFTGTVPEPLCCPVTQVIMDDPVTPCSGRTLERDMLRRLLLHKSQCACPLSRINILRQELDNATDICLNAYIQAFIDSNGKIKLSEIARLLTCPLTKELFKNPVTFACGLTLEKDEIVKKFDGTTDNSVKIEIDEKKYTIERYELQRRTNIAVKTLIEEYLVARKKQDAINERVRTARLSIFSEAAVPENFDNVPQTTTNVMKN